MTNKSPYLDWQPTESSAVERFATTFMPLVMPVPSVADVLSSLAYDEKQKGLPPGSLTWNAWLQQRTIMACISK